MYEPPYATMHHKSLKLLILLLLRADLLCTLHYETPCMANYTTVDCLCFFDSDVKLVKSSSDG